MPTVLLVEDNDDVREMMALALQLSGYEVLAAPNGREALRVLESRLPCLIVLDLMMPVMNGWELREALRHEPRLAQIPIVVVSALTGQLAERAEATEYLPKPVDIDRLIETVCTYCH